MVTSVWASNLIWTLLGLNWVLEGDWRAKWQRARESRLLQAILVLLLMHIVGLLWTTDMATGMMMLQIKLPLLVVPLVVLTSRPLTGRPREGVLWFYALAVFVVSIIGTVRLLTIPDLPYRDAVPYLSHIRFALNCCMVIYLASGRLFDRQKLRRNKIDLLTRIGAILLILWLMTFLVMLHSFTAFAVLAVVSLLILAVAPKQVMPLKRRLSLILLWLLLVGSAAIIVAREVHAYYRLTPLAEAPLPVFTPNGNPYFHANDGLIESGNYINNYICREELEVQWARKSAMPLDSEVEGGYRLESTLVRYLNALGLPKDSLGVSHLTPTQVADIEHGVANPVYSSNNPLRKMICVMLFEYESFLKTDNVKDFTMLERFELWGATLKVVEQYPWLGAGTGDVVNDMHACLSAKSEIADTNKTTHNQYLTLLASFGVVGFAIILFFFLRACRGLRRQPLFLLAWLFTILISFLTEDTLNTLMGILFCTWFLPFRNEKTCQVKKSCD